MPIELYLAPAAAGKTAWVIEQARQAAQTLTGPVRLIVPSSLQAGAVKQRLARAGGALGVTVQLFHDLYRTSLDAAAVPYTELPEPVQFRLLQAVVAETPLRHYAPIARTPGFIALLQSRLAEFKAAHITPEQLTAAMAQLGSEPRLTELAQLYTAYQRYLTANRWTDRAGLGWLAIQALTGVAGQSLLAAPHIFVDGFDNFTATQLEILTILADQVDRLVITLTGNPTGAERPLAHRRFNQTRQQLEAGLGITAAPLPVTMTTARPPGLAQLERHLFEPATEPGPADTAVILLEAPDRPAEVRAALRRLKARIVEDGISPADTALLARDMTPYRSAISQIGAEFGLPLRLVDGLPLSRNPLVAALLNLLRLTLPDEADQPALPYRAVLEAWRSPFFDGSESQAESDPDLSGEAARQLAALARRQQVLGGLDQWQTAFAVVAASEQARKELDLSVDDVAGLSRKFDDFVQSLTPPPEAASFLAFTAWLEDLIGSDPALTGRYAQAEPIPARSLRVVARLRSGPAPAANLAALKQLTALLRSLVWAEQTLTPTQSVTYPRFVEELTGLVETTFYAPPDESAPEAILVADVPQARGLSLAVVAVLGLAEGEFPTSLTEDPLLPETDRRRLIDLGLPLTSALESAEAEYFYEAVSRPRQSLLLTRPRLADNGAEWPASPFWETVRRLLTVQPEIIPQDEAPPPAQAASWPELLVSLSQQPAHSSAWEWLGAVDPAASQALDTAAIVLAQRQGRRGAYNGQLFPLADRFAADFGPRHTWSASRLETYLTCPFMFFTGRVLGVEPQAEPSAGLDAAQLGRIYHQLFEEVYRAAANPADLDDLLAALEAVAGPLLDQAPAVEGFRATAWWQHTRQTIKTNVRTSLHKFAADESGFTPAAFEAKFGFTTPFAVPVAEDQFYLRGFIDRVDRTAAGEFRIVDYKTGGPAGFTKNTLHRNHKLQLPLYALAARDGLDMGKLVDGFYWHVRQAQASDFTLHGFEDDEFGNGPDGAIDLAVAQAWSAVRGVRAGDFTPQPPRDGCPAYCPAAAFCRQYYPKGR